MHLFQRITSRRALLAAVLPAACAAAAVPGAAQAADHPNGFTFVNLTDDGTLHITAISSGGVNGPPPVANNIFVRIVGSDIRIADSQDDVLPGSTRDCVKVTDNDIACSLSKVKRIEAALDAHFAPAADDVWRADTSLPIKVDGGRGNDEFIRGNFSASSRLEVVGGDGFDRVHHVLAPSGVSVSNDDRVNDGRPGIDADNVHSDVEWLTGSLHADTLSGNNLDRTEFIEGMAGDDTLLGNGGRDVFRMGPVADGADRIVGGRDVDTVTYADRTRSVTANLSDGGADDGEAGEGDEIREVESARGGSAGDTLRGHQDGTTPMTLLGFGGNDTITGAGGGDTLNGGPGVDTITAGAGNDVVQARDSEADTVSCGTEFDTADVENGLDLFSGCEKFERLGVLKLSRAVQAGAAAPARLALSWRHPESWRKLRAVHVRLTDDGATVGEVKVAPRDGRMTADGAVRLIRKESGMTRRGKAASARLALRIDPSLAGRKLGIEVEAVDTRGRRQLERSAGTLRLAG